MAEYDGFEVVESRSWKWFGEDVSELLGGRDPLKCDHFAFELLNDNVMLDVDVLSVLLTARFLCNRDSCGVVRVQDSRAGLLAFKIAQ